MINTSDYTTAEPPKQFYKLVNQIVNIELPTDARFFIYIDKTLKASGTDHKFSSITVIII